MTPSTPNPQEPASAWWQQAWREREATLRAVFGETEPPGVVSAFYWDDIAACVPGGCALSFTASHFGRREVLTISEGLSQPLSPDNVVGIDKPSGYGWELAVVTKSPCRWRLRLIYLLMTYLMESRRRIEPGHRVPLRVFRTNDGEVGVEIGHVALQKDATHLKGISSMLFWPYIHHQQKLQTSTGTFGILIGTLIMQDELTLAKSTSSAHVLLALVRQGLGQQSDLDRQSILSTDAGQKEWRRIANRSTADVCDELRNGGWH